LLLQVNDIAMEALIESCNSDIRLVLNTLQVIDAACCAQLNSL
jgi:hypothetical protein